MNLFPIKSMRGFTLIELLVVIAIISLLSSVVLSNLSSVRERANNARRISDLQQIRTALELYANDNDGRYPIQYGWRGTTPNCYGNGSDPNAAIPGLVPNYLPQMPQDPKPTLPYNCYIYISNGVDYKLLAYGTVQGVVPAPGTPMARYPVGCGAAESTYAVYSPGYACT